MFTTQPYRIQTPQTTHLNNHTNKRMMFKHSTLDTVTHHSDLSLLTNHSHNTNLTNNPLQTLQPYNTNHTFQSHLANHANSTYYHNHFKYTITRYNSNPLPRMSTQLPYQYNHTPSKHKHNHTTHHRHMFSTRSHRKHLHRNKSLQVNLNFTMRLNFPQVIILHSLKTSLLYSTNFHNVHTNSHTNSTNLHNHSIQLHNGPKAIEALVVLRSARHSFLQHLIGVATHTRHIMNRILDNTIHKLHILCPHTATVQAVLPQLMITLRHMIPIPVHP